MNHEFEDEKARLMHIIFICMAIGLIIFGTYRYERTMDLIYGGVTTIKRRKPLAEKR